MEEQIRQSNRELIALSRLPSLSCSENNSYHENGSHVSREAHDILKRLAAVPTSERHLLSGSTGTQFSTGNHASPQLLNQYSPRHPAAQMSMGSQLSPRSIQVTSEQLGSYNRRNLHMISPTELPTHNPRMLTSQQQVAQLSHDLTLRNNLLRSSSDVVSSLPSSTSPLDLTLRDAMVNSLSGRNPGSDLGFPPSSRSSTFDASQAMCTSLQTQYLNQLLLPHILAAQAQAMSAGVNSGGILNPNMPPMPALISSANPHTDPALNTHQSLVNPLVLNPTLAVLMQQSPLLLQSMLSQQVPAASKSANPQDNLSTIQTRSTSFPNLNALNNLHHQGPSHVEREASVQEKDRVSNPSLEYRRLSDPALLLDRQSDEHNMKAPINTTVNKASRHQGLLVPASPLSRSQPGVCDGKQEVETRSLGETNESKPVKAEKDTLVAIIQKNIMGQLHNSRRENSTNACGKNCSTESFSNPAIEDGFRNPDDCSTRNPLDHLFKNTNPGLPGPKGGRKRKHKARETISASDIFNEESSRSGNSSPSVHTGNSSGCPSQPREEDQSASANLISALASDNGDRVSAILLAGSNSAPQLSTLVNNGTAAQGQSKHVNLKKNWAVQYQKQETSPGIANQTCQNNENSLVAGKKFKLGPGTYAGNGVSTGQIGKGARRGSRETVSVSDIFSKDPSVSTSAVSVVSNTYQKPTQSNSPDSSSGYCKPLDITGAYLQTDTCCVITPKPNLMCRDCRARGTNSANHSSSNSLSGHKIGSRCSSNGKTYCRFASFRKLKNSKNKYPSVVGFLEADRDASEDDLNMWRVLDTSFEALNSVSSQNGCSSIAEIRSYRKVPSRPDKAIFRVEQVGNYLCAIVHREQLVRNAYSEPVYWKRFVGGCRELCDVCSTSLFNYHWLCTKCGFVTCLDCYDSYVPSQLDMGILGTAETQQDNKGRVWLKCTKAPHVRETLMLTHFIPHKCLDTLLRDLHQECHRWGIYHQCQVLKNTNNDRSSLLTLTEQNNQLLPLPVKAPSPMCAVTSTSSPSPPAQIDPSDCDQTLSEEETNTSETVVKGGIVTGDITNNSSQVAQSSEDSKNEANSPAQEEVMDQHNCSDVKTTTSAVDVSEFDYDVNLKRRRSFNTFIDKVVESSFKNPVIDVKISREEYLKLLKLSTAMATKVPRNWELGLRDASSGNQPSTSQNVFSDYVNALRGKVRNVSQGAVLHLDMDKISSVEQAQFSVEWRLNKPIIVRGCGAYNESLKKFFTPEFLSSNFGSWKVDLVDCRTGRVHPMMLMDKFLQGFKDYSCRKNHFGQLSNGCDLRTVLKLKDWPPGNDFTDVMPKESHQLLMDSMPLQDYTLRMKGGNGGAFNLATSLPSMCCAPDMGPKMFIAYGSPNEPSVGSTNLHMDMSDAVNVLLYVCNPDGGSSESGETAEEARSMLMKEVEKFGGEEALGRLKRGEKVGAVWDIFNADDSDKLRKFLRNEAEIVHKAYRCDDDPIHDQEIFLSCDRLQKLKQEEGVEPFTFVQFENDSVFIPAGSAHQVRNLSSCIKAAVDFVSPERVKYCLKTTEEFRNLSDRHANHEDKLQIKSVIYHAVKDSLSVLKNTPHE